MITLTTKQWREIESKLTENYRDTPSVFLIRGTMKRVLGFTTRIGYIPDVKEGYVSRVYLDFFDDQKETIFILKYL
jgi:hypothetical protein